MKRENGKSAGIARAYCLVAGLLIVAVALVNAPFMVADEPNHFLGSVQISHGGGSSA